MTDFSFKSADGIFSALKTSKNGLSAEEAVRRLKLYGPNEIEGKEKIAPVLIFLSKFTNPILLMLLVAAAVSGFLDSPVNAVIIVVMVVASVFVDFLNTYKSNKAAEELKEKVNITATVLRSGNAEEIKIQKVVPGDIVELSAGDLVPADAVLIEAKDLFVNESTLTGESMPAEKLADGKESGSRAVFMGTSVVSGSARAAAVKTGKETRLGEISGKLREPEEKTEFDRNIADLSKFIFWTAISIIAVIIILNVLVERKSFLQIFLFAVAVAVGLSPELLPIIITANLARGALRISKNGAIVRKLSSIHDLGSVDILCADKTGTLTEDRIALIKHVDCFGRENQKVFFWGYLASFYLTGVRNTLDKAVKDYRKIDIGGWEKLDEVPFDYTRRRDSVVVKRGGEIIVITKGAPESLLAISSLYGDKREKMTSAAKKKILAEYESLSGDGFRVLGVATKSGRSAKAVYSVSDEKEMTFIGFLAFLDPPKRTAKETLAKMAAHNVAVKIVTGDNSLVTEKIAKEIGLEIQGIIEGDKIGKMSDAELNREVLKANIFARVRPEDKERIIKAFRANGHVVGYLGDGVNDVLPIKAADVGISVNNAVDIAKDTADIILLRKGLDEIIAAIIEGRKTFANLFKYLMIALSSNFGNMMSMPIGSLFLPFLPMTSSQILFNNFIYDASQLSIPFDEVDDEFVRRAKKFDLGFMKKFMIFFGPLSSVFDVLTFAVFYFVFRFAGGNFQTAWFLESIATQTLVVNIIRSFGGRVTKPSAIIFLSSAGAVILAWLVPLTPLGPLFGFSQPPLYALLVIAAITSVYLIAVSFGKKLFYRKWGALIER